MSLLALFAIYTGFILMPQFIPSPAIDTVAVMTGQATYYDYWLEWHPNYSLSHRTCAFHHQLRDYKMYRVCNIDNGKCVECYNNDWMASEIRLVDLSSYAFSLIWSKKRWILNVTVEKIE